MRNKLLALSCILVTVICGVALILVNLENQENVSKLNNYKEINARLEEKLKAANLILDETNMRLTGLQERQAKLERRIEELTKALQKPTYTMKATAYTAKCKGCTGITRTGIDIRNGVHKIVAVDKSIIPLGSKVEIFANGKSMGIWDAQDTGGGIKGHEIDILMPTLEEAENFGVQTVYVRVVEFPPQPIPV